MKNQHTDITIVIDKSGSMEKVRDDTRRGLNRFISDQQKAPGTADLSIILFDTTVRPFLSGVDIRKVQPLTEDQYQPGGSTALLDAIGQSIVKAGDRFKQLPESERPEKVLFVIMTDGEENSSREYNHRQINDMITHQRDVYKWGFEFIGADLDAIATASQIGIWAGQAISTANNTVGTAALYASLSSKVRMYRAAGGQGVNSVSWSDEDRAAQKKAGAK